MQTLARPSTLKAKKITPTMHRAVRPNSPIVRKPIMSHMPIDEWERFLDVIALHPPFAGVPFSLPLKENERLEVVRLRSMGASYADLSKSTGISQLNLKHATDYVRRWYAVG